MMVSNASGLWSYFMVTEMDDCRINYEHFAEDFLTGKIIHLGLPWSNPTPTQQQIYAAINIKTQPTNT